MGTAVIPAPNANVKKSEIINNLTSTSTTAPLSANMGKTLEEHISAISPTPYVASIPTGQWSGSGSDRYITVQASNVTADSILIPSYDSTSQSRLNGPVWCVPAAGSFTIHTTAIPSNTVNIMVQFVGTLGTAQYQVLSDVYSKSQVDSIVAQSTANRTLLFIGTTTPDNTTVYALSDAYTKYNWIMIRWVTNDDTGFQILNAVDIEQNISKGPMFVAMAANSSGLISSFPYISSCRIHFTDSTHFKVLGFWTNANYVAKVTNVWGINPK